MIDVPSREVVMTGLSMPHSPRCYQGKLWLLNSGTGYVGTVDVSQGKFEPLTFCPGYLRGMAFWKHYIIVGVSRARHKAFSGLALDDNLKAKDAEARSGLLVIDSNTGDIVHWLRIEGSVRELYDVVVLPGVRRPMAVGLLTDEIQRVVTIGERSFILPDASKTNNEAESDILNQDNQDAISEEELEEDSEKRYERIPEATYEEVRIEQEEENRVRSSSH